MSSSLLVSYMFPPAGGIGVQRALALARYLPDAGLHLHVLTARNPVTHVYDPALAQRIPAAVRVHPCSALEPPYALRQAFKRVIGHRHQAAPSLAPAQPAGPLRRFAKQAAERLLFPDPQRLWAGPAISAAARLIEREHIGSVLITLPPFSLLALAPALRRRFPALRIVIDFRDEWLQYHLEELDGTASAWKRTHAAALELAAVHAADAVVTVTDTWVERLRRRYPAEPAAKFVLIPNGYDPASFAHFQSAPPPQPPFILSYLGTLYSNPVYSPAPFLDALDRLPAPLLDRLETRFIGRVAPDVAPLLEGRRARLLQTGFLPQDDAFARLAASHALLLLLGTATVHSGKLFEYLATGLPILAITPPGGEAARVIESTGSGLVAAPDNPAAIAAALERLLSGPPLPPSNQPAVQQYDRSRQAAVFARLLTGN
jgi:glycosyltransferase involved in cell wall biosynthesis